MKIQNAPLEPDLKERIQTFVINMGNILACQKATGIQTLTLHNIMKREWASIKHIKKLTDYCDKVENFSKTKQVA